MPDPNERLQTTQWLIERQLGWITAADAKIAVVVAIDTAMVAALAAAYTSAEAVSPWATALSIGAAALVVVAMACAAMSLLPRTSGPQSSLLFFGTIANSPAADYVAAITDATADQLQADFALQVHRNAEIAAVKHHWVRRSVGWSFLAALPWAFAIGLLVRQ
jgi:hypothetical protein